jgi:hypothetical protein
MKERKKEKRKEKGSSYIFFFDSGSSYIFHRITNSHESEEKMKDKKSRFNGKK